METGSRASVVHECCRLLAVGLGAELMGVRVGYASISVTLSSGANTITRMVTVTGHRVDARLNDAVRRFVAHAAATALPPAEIHHRLDGIVASARRYPSWLMALAVGVACAAFGGLLGIDDRAFVPVGVASCLAQFLRRHILGRGANAFVATAATAFVAAAVAGLLARAAASGSVDLAMISATLLLVPGVPATNAQADILDGFPTLGSARAVSVVMTMVFATTGIWAARAVLGVP